MPNSNVDTPSSGLVLSAAHLGLSASIQLDPARGSDEISNGEPTIDASQAASIVAANAVNSLIDAAWAASLLYGGSAVVDLKNPLILGCGFCVFTSWLGFVFWIFR